ncbi:MULTISPECIES: Sec-independent protein translocase protein TatB [unclassified Sphingopyxis]|jgi:sec-independent protein translocase protein TatB|uniref:Sec-independent protein translocase protein TatB n=1 Tax=unclassified Sphingopyxis TaxID=2614943 RepID=UPI002854E263|nr:MULTISPECIES: Sec-independent protein translocase protein TatB [unclassified Sphingopyxis]MDR7059988.1 sec-independent protein translocase protein TatB [Sphingopyxis sp. BE235]MDR7180500.1 sec-independent protein translocase protein TatB [Sphingopyxis sp. BE249]
MFDVAPTELLLVVLVALVVIGPKDLPKAMRFVGKWMAKARGMARHFRSGLDTMMREAELEELEKQWREQNDAIMREFPRIDDVNASPATPSNAASTEPTKTEPVTEAGIDEAAAANPPETHAIPPKDGPLP